MGRASLTHQKMWVVTSSAESPLRNGGTLLDSGRNCPKLRRAHAVEASGAVGRLRISELELAGQHFGDAAERRPVAHRQRRIGGGQDGERCARVVGETEMERAIGQSDRKRDV